MASDIPARATATRRDAPPPAQGDPELDPGFTPSRSSFILVGLAGLCAVVGVVFFGATVRYEQRADPQARNTRPKRVPLKDLRFDAAGVSQPISYDMGDSGVVGIFLVRRGTELLALEQTCTHRGCPVAWHAAEDRFSCPCHGSAFARDGQVVQQPAPYGLYRHRLTVEPDAVTIEGRV